MTEHTARVSSSVTGKARVDPQGTAVTSTLADALFALTGSAEFALTYGTASGEINLLCGQDRTLNAATAETFDLYTGSDLKELNGGTAAFRKVKLLVVYVISGGDTAGLVVGGAAADQWVGFFGDVTDKHKVFPSGPAYQGGSPAGVAVGATTKNLKVENLGAVAVTYRIVVAGTNV
jgi:hypothetical protein